MVFLLQESIVIVEAYLRTGSIKETQQAFLEKYPEIKAPAKRSFQSLVKKWRETGSVENAKKQRPKLVRTPEVVSDIQQRTSRSHKSRLGDYPSKSVYHEQHVSVYLNL